MGILDSVFAGEQGLSSILHKLLGGTATIRIYSYERDTTTGALVSSYVEYEVPFVPSNTDNSQTPLNTSGSSRNDIRENVNVLSGTFPCSSLNASMKAERDSIVFDGVEFRIESFETLSVGNHDVQYSIRARRC